MATDAALNYKDSQRASFFPNLKLRAQYSLSDQPDRISIPRDSLATGLPLVDTNITNTHRDTYQMGVYLNQPIFTGGNLWHTYVRSGYQHRAAENQARYHKEQLTEQVKQVFAELLAANVRVTSLSKSLEARKNQSRIVKDRLLEGYANREELLLAGASLSATEAKLVQASNHVDALQLRLYQLIGAQPDERFDLSGKLKKLRIDQPLDDFVRQADLFSRPDLQALRYRVKQREEEVGVARSGFFPSVSLQAGYTRQSETSVVRPEVWSITLNAEWSLFDWGKTVADVRRSNALSRQEAYSLDESMKTARNEVVLLWRQSRAELGTLLETEAQLKSAEHIAEKTLNRFLEGKARRADVLDAEAALWLALGEYHGAAAVVYGTMASLERATTSAMGRWVVDEPLYQPDLEGFSQRMTKAFNHAGAGRAAKPVVISPALVEVGTAVTVPTMRQQAPASSVKSANSLKSQVPSGAVADKKVVIMSQQGTGHSPRQQEPIAGVVMYRIQLGAFSKRENAELLLKAIIPETSPLKPSIVYEDGLYRVVSAYYNSRSEAIQSIQPLGIKNYMVRAGNRP
ncbi:MAG: TolC family protein [Geobacteraceae bacterium]|nr:TolC family protein [Geobacteraceae bacterium]